MALFKKFKPEPKKEAKKEAIPVAEVKRGPLVREHAGQAHRILVRPTFTEKAARLESLGKYTFIVSAGANKNDVAQAVRDLYGVKPVSVRIINRQGKNVRFGRSTGKEKNEKKAVVTLKSGDSITVAEAA